VHAKAGTILATVLRVRREMSTPRETRPWLGTTLLGAVFTLLAIGSKVEKRDPDAGVTSASATATASATVNIPPRLREDVIAATKPFGRGEYAPKDPAFVDPCIADAIARTETGSEKYDERVTRAASCLMRKLQSDPAGQVVLAKIIAARYAAPVITRTADVVRVDLGQVAGEVKDHGRLRVVTDLWTSDGLAPSEVVKHLKLAMEKEPSAERYQVEVQNEVPRGRSVATAHHTYVYRRSKRQIEVYTGEKNRCFTAPLPDDLSGVTSLRRTDLTCEALPFGAGGFYDPRVQLER
jgi:hypothetical protein